MTSHINWRVFVSTSRKTGGMHVTFFFTDSSLVEKFPVRCGGNKNLTDFDPGRVSD